MNSAIDGLRLGDEDRALAIMLNHRTHLNRSINLKSARFDLREAKNYAEAGGHEDIRNRILINQVQLSQFHSSTGYQRTRRDWATLKDVEHYARMMGSESLLVDTLHTQGKILLNSGDNSGSGRLFTRAISIARRNQMDLRLNSIMTSHAQVLMMRQRDDEARRILESSLTMAKRTEFSLEVVRIHDAQHSLEAGTYNTDTDSSLDA